jgi:gliding motility-associated lipoprotein GldH
MRFKFFLVLAALAFLTACDKENIAFEKNYPLKNEAWSYSDTLNFSFSIADTMALYDIRLAIKHRQDYRFQNLYTQIYTAFPTGERTQQILNFDLAENSGKWLGERSGDYALFEVNIQENAFFNKMGDYTLTLEQFMRQDSLSGIAEIQLKLIQKEGKRDLEAEKKRKTKK